MTSLARIFRKLRQAGWRKTGVVLADSIRRAVAPRLNDRRVLYRIDPQAFAAAVRPTDTGMAMLRIERLEDVPSTFWQRMDGAEARDLQAQFANEFGRNAVLWIAEIGGEMAGSQWTAEGRHRPDWFIPLGPGDLVLYAVSTRSGFRGRGVHAALMRHIIAQALAAGVAIYCDVAVWNGVARRNSERVGFRAIGIHAPLH